MKWHIANKYWQHNSTDLTIYWQVYTNFYTFYLDPPQSQQCILLILNMSIYKYRRSKIYCRYHYSCCWHSISGSLLPLWIWWNWQNICLDNIIICYTLQWWYCLYSCFKWNCFIIIAWLHSKFVIPVPTTQNSTCNIHQGSHLAELLNVTKLIV